MEDEKKGTEAIVETIPAQDDLEAKVKELEEEKANYQAAYLKERAKNHDDESDEQKFRRIAREELESSRIMDIDKQKDAIIAKALKENKELKLARLNKTDIPASTTVHSEGQSVKDTMITPDQMATFKSQGRSDKWIENYKRNLSRNAR